jgi:zinc/manganese transport system permease protein
LLETALLYAVIGVVHVALRRPFFAITNDPEAARAGGHRIFWWDFVFYALFGVVVTSSVQIAGVLLVFGLLVIPAVAGVMTTSRTLPALAVGWSFAFVASTVGMLGSLHWDMPAAPSILVSLTLFLGLHGIALRLRGHHL